MVLAERKSFYVKGLTWSGIYECGVCGLEVNSAHSTFREIDGVLTRRPLGFSEDHIVPSSKGGNDDIDNIQPTHFLCNVFKRDYALDGKRRSEIRKKIKEFIDNPYLEVAASLHIDCGVCDKRFYVQNAVFLRNTKRYCSTDCQHTASRRRIETSCLKCGSAFKTIQSRLDNGKGKYCSLICYSSHRDKVKYNCQQCSRDYYVSRKNNRAHVKKGCSACRKNIDRRPARFTVKSLI